MSRKKRNILIIVFTLTIGAVFYGFVRNDFEIVKNIDIYASILKQLDEQYVDEINVNDLLKTSVDAMLSNLDPYTVFYQESDLEEFKLMTTGQYGGIGALIQQDSDYVIISEPYDGWPAFEAGLNPGDKILEIEGKSVQNKTFSDVSAMLRGQPGTKLKMNILPYGKTKSVNKEIVRKEIKLPNISYSGLLDNHIGYIRLDQFTDNAGDDMKQAFQQLKTEGMQKLIIDLRGNGGGLLNEAINIVNLFVDKGNIVVKTQGKNSSKNQIFPTLSPALDTKIPIVVLVDRTSASASEIVAGSLQDFDRAVLVGQRTYGKGLVQNIVPLAYNTRMKVTVSKYYIPSGRCIQAVDYANKDENGQNKRKADSLATAFKTKGGRIVYDYGGVEPDINNQVDSYSTVLLAMMEKHIVFNFANEFKLKHATIPDAKEFTITDEIYNDFVQYVKTKNLEYKTFTEKQLEQLKRSVKDDKFSDNINAPIAQLEQVVAKEKENDLFRYKKEISELLQVEIASRYYHQKGGIEASLSIDPDVNKAKEILLNNDVYTSILKGTYKK